MAQLSLQDCLKMTEQTTSSPKNDCSAPSLLCVCLHSGSQYTAAMCLLRNLPHLPARG